MTDKRKARPSTRAERMHNSMLRIQRAAECVTNLIINADYLNDADLKAIRAEGHEIDAACETYAEANKP